MLPRADCCCLVWYAVMLSAIVLALGSLSCFELDLSTGLLSKPGGEQVSSIAGSEGSRKLRNGEVKDHEKPLELERQRAEAYTRFVAAAQWLRASGRSTRQQVLSIPFEVKLDALQEFCVLSTSICGNLAQLSSGSTRL